MSEALKKSKLPVENLVCIPTSFQAKQLIIENGLRLGSLEQYPEIDITIDGADEVDEKLNLIKGGGGCQTMEKLVAFAAKHLFIVCDESKKSKKLFQNWTKGLPIEVIPESYTVVQNELKKIFPKYSSSLRLAEKKAGPVVTDNGNFIIDMKVCFFFTFCYFFFSFQV